LRLYFGDSYFVFDLSFIGDLSGHSFVAGFNIIAAKPMNDAVD
jgi:hypothetical protein